MLSVLLSILKIIGWILLIIVAVLVTLALLILFVPVLYRVEVKKDDEVFVLARFTWLLRIVFVKFIYVTGKLVFRVRLFGVLVFDSGRPKKVKKVKSKLKSKQKPIKEGQSSHTEKQEIWVQPHVVVDQKEEKKEQKKEQKRAENTRQKPKVSFFDKINHAKGIVRGLCDKKKSFTGFMKEEENKKALLRILLYVKKLFLHAKPKNIKGYIEYGFDDPALTGEITGLLSLFLSFYPENLRITPNFENSVLTAEVVCYGRIRMIHLLIITIRMLRDKQLKKLIGNVKKLKEEI